MIHPTAILSNAAQLGENVNIGPYCVIEDDVIIGDNCILTSHAILRDGARLENNVTIDSFAVISGNPQDHKFDPTLKTQVYIGSHSTIREGVTIHRATNPDQPTTIGSHALLMAYAHVGHDCQIGQHVTIANQSLLSGCVLIEDYVFISGCVAIHQFTKIGESAIISGHSAIGFDTPPYTIAAKRGVLGGFNLVGLKRRGFSQEIINDLKSCYKKIYRGDGAFEPRLKNVLATHQPTTPEGKKFLDFFRHQPNKRFITPEFKKQHSS